MELFDVFHVVEHGELYFAALGTFDTTVRMRRQMAVEGRRPGEGLVANDAGERANRCMNTQVNRQADPQGELFATLLALVALFGVVHGTHVLPQAKVFVEHLQTERATKRTGEDWNLRHGNRFVGARDWRAAQAVVSDHRVGGRVHKNKGYH